MFLCVVKSFIAPSHNLYVLATIGQYLQLFMNQLLSVNYERWWKNICHCLSFFLSFLPFLYLLQSVPFSTKAGGLVVMRGIIYTNLINIIFPSSFIFLLSPSTVCCLHAPWGPSFPPYPRCTSLRFPLAADLKT